MRLITDEQHAQIVEALIYRSDCDAKEAVQLRYANGFPKWAPSYVQENYLPLYAKKEPS